MNESLYKSVLLDHFRNPRNKGDLDAMSIIRRGSNPRCGDDIEVGLCCENGHLSKVRFRGRGCSVCLASASMMSECTEGLSAEQAATLSAEVQNWIEGERDTPPSPSLVAFNVVRENSARKKCVQLAWRALSDAINDYA
jgi:nitrogen fixation NifU-like protein